MSLGFTRVVMVVGTLAAACGPGSTTTALPSPTSTTIAMAGSPCAPAIVTPDVFENYVAAVPSPTARPPFTGASFTGVGKVVSVGADSVVLELADTMFRAFGPTTVKVNSTTNFDRDDRAWTLVAGDGLAAGATDVPLAAGAPAVDAGAYLFFECHRGAGVVTGESAVTAKAAPAGATTWTLTKGVQFGWPKGTMVWYDRVDHHAALADLHLAAGQSVYIEITCAAAGDCVAKKLTFAGVAFGYRGL